MLVCIQLRDVLCCCVLQSYTMRNSILGVLGEMISRVLSGEDLDAKQKSTRDQFLDKLEVVIVLHNCFVIPLHREIEIT